MNLSNEQIKQLNDFEDFLEFKKTWIFEKFTQSPEKVVALFTGNQFGKTAGVAFGYVMRILGIYPVIEKNVVYYECENEKCYCLKSHPAGGKYRTRTVFRAFNPPETCPLCGFRVVLHKRGSRVFRFCSHTLPGGGKKVQKGESSDLESNIEVKNTQYPAFKKWLPGFLIKADTTYRDHFMVVKDPFGGEDIIVEFVGYTQQVQATAGTQRMSVWYDEEPSQDFRNEQIPRLLAENGDEVVTLTPANYISWMYDDIFEHGSYFYRTDTIIEFLKESDDKEFSKIEIREGEKDVAVLQAATDDNPTLKPEAIKALFDNLDDPDVLAIRRYGIFKQVSGRIFKDFTFSTHMINGDKLFPNGVPFDWIHARGIDYHPQTPWAFGMICLSDTNEAFIYGEESLSPERFTIEEIASILGEDCGDYEFRLTLIDPLAEAHKRKEGNRTVTVRDDLNSRFSELKHEGVCRGGFWRTWDTKGEKGRDEIRKRLKNSLKVGKPFNNKFYDEVGNVIYLPTIWIFDSCKVAAKSMRQWRWEEFGDAKSVQEKEAKNKPEQRWSHMNMVWEAIFKSQSFKPGSRKVVNKWPKKKQYFNSKRSRR